MDALETVKRARDMGMRAVVLKNTYFPTTPMADIIEKLVPEVKVFGSVCLDYEIGGLNYQALEPLAKFGTKVVWMPTHSSTNSRANMRRLPGVTLEGEGFSLLDCCEQTGAGSGQNSIDCQKIQHGAGKRPHLAEGNLCPS